MITHLRRLHPVVLVFIHLCKKVRRHLLVPDEHVAFGETLLHLHHLDVKHHHSTSWNFISCAHTNTHTQLKCCDAEIFDVTEFGEDFCCIHSQRSSVCREGKLIFFKVNTLLHKRGKWFIVVQEKSSLENQSRKGRSSIGTIWS